MLHRRECTPGATGPRLLPDARVCYKRYMRKWMRDRLKRRKPGGEGQAAERAKAPAPAPLRPDFYSEPPVAAAAPVVEFQPEVVPEELPEAPEPAPESPVANAHPQPSVRPSRRRRGRGGRSRRERAAGQPLAVPQAQATP